MPRLPDPQCCSDSHCPGPWHELGPSGSAGCASVPGIAQLAAASLAGTRAHGTMRGTAEVATAAPTLPSCSIPPLQTPITERTGSSSGRGFLPRALPERAAGVQPRGCPCRNHPLQPLEPSHSKDGGLTLSLHRVPSPPPGRATRGWSEPALCALGDYLCCRAAEPGCEGLVRQSQGYLGDLVLTQHLSLQNCFASINSLN